MFKAIAFIILAIVATCTAINIREPDPRYRIINLGEPVSDSSSAGDKSWMPITRAQFMRDILFGIHPDSPRNKESWIKSGYLKPTTSIKRSDMSSPAQPQVKLDTNLKLKRQNRIKPGFSYIRRVPKAEGSGVNATPETATVMNTTANATMNMGPVPAPQKLPIGVPIVPNTPPKPGGRQAHMPRCFSIRTTVVKPVIYYVMSPASVPSAALPYQNNYYPRPISLYQSGSYVPIQNRLSFPPTQNMFYVRPVPWDLLAMEDIEDDSQPIYKETKVATSKVPSESDDAVIISVEKVEGQESDKDIEKPVDNKLRQEPIHELKPTSTPNPENGNFSDATTQVAHNATISDVKTSSDKVQTRLPKIDEILQEDKKIIFVEQPIAITEKTEDQESETESSTIISKQEE